VALVKFSTAFGLVLRNKPTRGSYVGEEDKERKDEENKKKVWG
jgi:hypothetical protein